MTPHLPTHEIQVGAIIGIRVWYVRDYVLHSSMGQCTKWTPGLKRVARKENGRHNGGCIDCPGRSAPCILNRGGGSMSPNVLQCGLHATPDIAYFPGHVPPYYTTSDTFKVVFGLVRLFGRVIEGTYGWRAEFAEVHALCDDVPSPKFACCDDVTLANMALRYAVPILYLEELSLQATQIGGTPCVNKH